MSSRVKQTCFVPAGILLLFALGLALLPGCGGCGGDEEEDAAAQSAKTTAKTGDPKEEEKKEPEDDFTVGRFSVQPYEEERVESYFKPGHWSTAVLDVTANKFDLNGELAIDPFQLDGMPYELGTSRPAFLPKTQKKQLDVVFFVPPGGGRTNVHARLTGEGGAAVYDDSFPARRMEEHEFLLVVLAKEPESYAYLKNDDKLDAIWPRDAFWGEQGLRYPYYRVIRPAVKDRVALPDNSLTWTAIAYVWWDGVDPKLLLPAQRQALLDWLHWGGQLVVSGPESLPLLEGSFLEPYLPAVAEGDVELTSERLSALDHWRREGDWLVVAKPWAGKKLKTRAEQGAVETVKANDEPLPLVVERNVGAGRIVLSAFQLNQQELRQWSGFDNFLNNVLLRRPPRSFKQEGEFGEPSWDWNLDRTVRLNRTDPRVVSGVRYFTRDGIASSATIASVGLDQQGGQPSSGLTEEERIRRRLPSNYDYVEDEFEQQARRSRGAGVAGWDDFNHLSTGGRETLRRSAGIKVPEGGFVLWVVGVYLIVLVPVNWGVFKLIGRVEWAWIAAPIITLVAALCVVRLAELDIGFARARTEVAVVELQPGYPRAHVTRYTALYTSLSTQYDLEFSDPTALVQPFPRFTPAEQRQQFLGDIETLHYRHTADAVSLTGFQVPSNSTGMLHSEHMLDVGGGISLEQTAAGWRIVNGTKLDLKGVAVLRPNSDGEQPAVAWPIAGLWTSPQQVEIAWLGDLPAGEKRSLGEFDLSADQLWRQHRDQDDITAETTRIDVLKLRLLTKLAEDPATFRPGELRLVAWSDSELAGLEITPAAKERRFANLVVAHLQYGPRPGPFSDDGSRQGLGDDGLEMEGNGLEGLEIDP
jgi:hypothetical protein